MSLKLRPSKPPRKRLSAQALRMIRIREMVCAEREFTTQQEFADWLGVSLSRWNNVERGYPVSRDLANILVKKIPGMSKDWIDDERTDALSVGLARRLAGADQDAGTP